MPTASCPPVADYQKLLNGELPTDGVAGLSGHLEACERCAAAVQTLLSADTLGESLSAARSPALAQLPPALVSKLLALPHAPDSGIDGSAATLGSTAPNAHNADDTAAELPGMAAPQAADEIGRLGGYRVLGVLGRGGMGIVYLAEDVHLQRRVALKVMKPDLARDGTPRRRFLAEARAAAKVRSDHVVTIYQTGEAGGTAFAAMELLRGQSLDSWLRAHPAADPRELVRIGYETALGLAAEHAEGLIHRDVKPANIWVETSGRVKILDFGLARGVEGDVQLTHSGAVVGTPAFMAPEQARGGKVDHRADLFSLGCVLHRIATGQLPFPGGTVMSVLTALATETPEPAHELNPAIPRRLSALISRLLAKDPAARPQTARAAADELKAILAKLTAPNEPHVIRLAPAAGEPSAADLSETLDFRERTEPVPAKRRPRRWLPVAVVAALVVVAGVAAGQFVFGTKDGTLIVEVDDAADVRFKKGKLEIYDAGGRLLYTLEPSEKNKTLPPGKYLVKVVGADGVKLETDTFELERKGKSHVRVTAAGPQVAAAKDPDPVKPGTPATAEEVAAAEWVLNRNGFVTVRADGKDVVVNKTKHGGTEVTELPKGKFTIVGVNLSPVNAKTLPVNDHDLRQLACLKQLEALDLNRQEKVTAAGLAHFAGCTDLKSLRIFGSGIGDDGVATASQFRRLEHFMFPGDNMPSSRWVEMLGKTPTLRTVVAYRCDLNDAGVALPAALPKLEAVELTGVGNVTDAGLKTLAGCKTLRSITLGARFKMTDVGFAPLAALPNLETLDLSHLFLTDASLKALESCKSLRTLKLGDNLDMTKGAAQALKQALPDCTIIYQGNTLLAPPKP